jgi:membrane associated rhomboid family serine protease
MTEGLILLNLMITCVLFLVWRDLYDMRLTWFLRFVRNFVGSGKGFFALLAPMFMHASPSHLFYNMIALLAAGSVTEYFYGRGRMLATYLMAGFGGAAMSLALRPMPAVSVGASGAIFGLYGLSILFLLRNFRRFDDVHRWKTFRVYLPIAALAVFPSIAGERIDFYGHLGGLLTGCAIGIFLPAGARLTYVTEKTKP